MADIIRKELLLLDATQQLECANANKWNFAQSDSVKMFINSIITSLGTDKESAEKYRTMISGVPSPWARVTITRKALTVNKKQVENVLDLCYKTFKSEWRGLMAAYVLRSDDFELSEPIPLVGPTVVENAGDMSVLQTYGEMLFEDMPLWTLKKEMVSKTGNPPCIQILYYKNVNNERIPVGATSPFTYFFSSVNYNLSSAAREISWVGEDGKLVDPTSGTKQYLTEEEMRRLHAFLVSIGSMIVPSEGETANPDKYYLNWIQAVMNANAAAYHPDVAAIAKSIKDFQQELSAWATEIATALNGNVNPNVPINTPRPKGPLSLLLNSEKEFYLQESTLYTKPDADRKMIKSTEILLDSEYIAAWRGGNIPAKNLADSCAYYLEAENEKLFLALPFTEHAFEVFKNAIKEIMGGNHDISLSARTLSGSQQVEVKLYAVLDKQGAKVPVAQKTYRIEVIDEGDGKVFTWPNFHSPQWRYYYYYSEFPTNVSGVRMVPLYEGEGAPKFNSEEDRRTNQQCYLVQYPLNKVDASAHKYEIIRTEQRVIGVQIWINKAGTEVLSGTLMMREDKYKTPGNSPRNAIVGIDFGSTNTCAYYKLAGGGGDATPVPFANRRMAIVGFDNEAKKLAQKDELLFISNEEPLNKNGQVKSWLHDHNLFYLTPNGSGRLEDVSRIDEEIVGGVPVNESNIVVCSMDKYTIQTNAGTLYYNMKWLQEDKSTQRKTSFIRMLWLQICADLYENNLKPSELNWSFPGSMSSAGRNDLKSIFRKATTDSPFGDGIDFKMGSSQIHDYTEAEADCAFANVRDTVDSHNIVLGIDVGGSTSDILILGQKDGKRTLFTQSSVRIASGFFFDAIKKSAKFRNSLKNFHDSNVVQGLNVVDIQSIVSNDPDIYGRAPYFLNNVFDQLKSDRDFRLFYNRLHTEVRPIFALPAYVTGMLVFYCGMLVRNAILENNLDIQNVTLRHYGKGGRLFEWISDIDESAAEIYYRECFKAGVGAELAKTLRVSFGETLRFESKSEVAIGLVSNIDLISSGELDENDMRIIKNFDIIGEEGVEYVNGPVKELQSSQDVIPEKLFKGAVNAEFSTKMENFSKFLDIFIRFVGERASIMRNVSALEAGKEKVNVTSFINNDDEFKKTCKDNKSYYRQPVIIVEALDYLNKVLLPQVASEIDR